jgi:hypothetical protein
VHISAKAEYAVRALLLLDARAPDLGPQRGGVRRGRPPTDLRSRHPRTTTSHGLHPQSHRNQRRHALARPAKDITAVRDHQVHPWPHQRHGPLSTPQSGILRCNPAPPGSVGRGQRRPMLGPGRHDTQDVLTGCLPRSGVTSTAGVLLHPSEPKH